MWALLLVLIAGLGIPAKANGQAPASTPKPGTVVPRSLVLTSAPAGGFCVNGVNPNTVWRPEVLAVGPVWGSYCKGGNTDRGWKASQTLTAATFLSIYASGYPGTGDVRLGVLNLRTGQQLLLRFPIAPREGWLLESFRLPSAWRGQLTEVVASDQSTTRGGWLGFAQPTSSDAQPKPDISGFRIAALTALFVLLLFLPSIAACSLAALNGVDDLLDLTAVAFLVLGLIGYTSFWTYFASRKVGLAFSHTTLAASCAVLMFVLSSKTRRCKLSPLRHLLAPGALLILGSIFIISLGLLHGSHESPVMTADTRYAPPELPLADNYLPKIFADDVFARHIAKPMVGDWLSSDRPPLQAGNSLWTYAWVGKGNRDLTYLLCSTILQCSFLVGLWSCLRAFEIEAKPLVVCLAVTFFCGFTYVNAFYTWPKLYSAAFLLVIAGYLLPGQRYKKNKNAIAVGVLIGGLTALSMLAHGGSAFALLGVVPSILILRLYPHRSLVLTAAAVAFGLYLPWMIYQKRVDPPGDRLLKWHLAGVKPAYPHQSFRRLLIANYRKLTPAQVLGFKLANLQTVARDLPEEIRDMRVILWLSGKGDRGAAAASLRASIFYHWTPCIGLGIFGIPLFLLGGLSRYRKQNEFAAASRMWLCTALIIVIWCLLMYDPHSTVVHQGTYLTVIFALAGSWLAFWALSPALAVVLATLQIAYNALVFIWFSASDVMVGGIPVVDPVFSGFRVMAAMCALSAAGFIVVLILGGRTPNRASHSATLGRRVPATRF